MGRIGGPAGAPPESSAREAVGDAHQHVRYAELSRVGPDVRVLPGLPDDVRHHGGRCRIWTRLDGLRALAVPTVEAPSVGLLEEPPRGVYLGWVLGVRLRDLRLRRSVRNPLSRLARGEHHPGRRVQLLGQHPRRTDSDPTTPREAL